MILTVVRFMDWEQSRMSKQRYMRAEDRETASAIECDVAPQRRLDSVVDDIRDIQADLETLE